MITFGLRADNIKIQGNGIPADSRLDEGFVTETPFPSDYGVTDFQG
jgi:hypothetical protein